jgi:hypothetical protein
MARPTVRQTTDRERERERQKLDYLHVYKTAARPRKDADDVNKSQTLTAAGQPKKAKQRVITPQSSGRDIFGSKVY